MHIGWLSLHSTEWQTISLRLRPLDHFTKTCLSQRGAEICLSIDVSTYAEHQNFPAIRALNDAAEQTYRVDMT